MKQSKTKEVEIETCDWCGEELFEYDERGKEPKNNYGRLYCETEEGEKLCVPKCQNKYFKQNETK